ncbi:MAG: hypothetical protein M3Y21_05535 [Candidatus Eremiobacteraeota bacterium]|nr:hypothetical protein [Candidatus Eremiobacteraeota bacterium]
MTKDRRRRVLEFAVILSVILHLIVGPLLVRWGLLTLPDAKIVPPRFTITTSSALHLEKRAHAQPTRPNHPHVAVATRQPRTQPKLTLRTHESPRHRELARITRKAAIPQPQRAIHHARAELSVEDIARQEQQFAKTIAQARTANNPLSVAPEVATPAAVHHSQINFEGQSGEFQGGHGVLIPIQHWIDGDNHCYRVHYELEYYSGGSEEGNVPWPICYPARRDPFEQPPHQMPLPPPMPDYVLPPDAELEPYLKKYFPNRYPNAGPP